MSEIFGMENFAFADVAGAFDATQTTLNLNVDDTGRFNVFPALATLHNITDFANAHEAFVAGDAEIIEIVSKAGDTFNVIKRGQDGTVGIATTAGANYRVSVIATRAQWNLTCRAPADGSGPFDAILAGTPTVVADAVFRFIKDNGIDDCVGSIQGSPALGDRTKLILGDTAVPEKLKLETQVGSSPAQVGRLDMSGVSFLHLSSDGGLGILRAAGASNDNQAHIGQTLSVDKLIGQREGGATIAAGVLSINTQFVRVSAEGGPGADDLDELLVPLADVPFGSRILVILEPNTTAHNITIRDKFIAGGSANIKLEGGGTFNMQSQGEKIALITDGVGPTGLEWEEVWRSPPKGIRDKYVLVKIPGDFPAPSAGVITLAAGVTYEINGTVDLGTDRIVATGAGCIRSACTQENKLLTTNASALITSTDGLEMDELTLENDIGPIFDVSGGGTGSFVITRITLNGSTRVGDVDNCAVISVRRCVVQGCADGFSLDLASSFVLFNGILSNANTGTFTFLTIPATASFIGLSYSDMAIDSLVTQTALDINSGATITERGLVSSSAFTGAGTALAGITKADIQWQFRSNTGILDSKIIGEIIISANALVTTIVTIDVFVSINATFSNGLLERFTRAGDTLTYIGELDVEVQIIGNLNIFGVDAIDKTAEARILVNGTPVGIFGHGFVDVTRHANVIPMANVTLSTGDTIDIEIANSRNTDNLIVEDMLLTVSER